MWQTNKYMSNLLHKPASKTQIFLSKKEGIQVARTVNKPKIIY